MTKRKNPGENPSITISGNSILVLDRHGILRRLTCPFKVRVRNSSPGRIHAKVFYVDEVKPSDAYLMVYMIRQKPFPFYMFVIVLP
jgi:hypothetical protein